MTDLFKKKIILASSSPRRIELLKKFVPSVKNDSADIDETPYKNERCEDFVIRIAKEKAYALSNKYPSSLIIAADTVVYFKNSMLGKPSDTTEAKEMLKRLCGNRHFVYTGLCVLDTESSKFQTDIVSTEVYMDTLSDDEIEYYVNSLEPLDKAGAYGIQDIASLFIRKIDGDYFNVVGLPLYKLKKIFECFDINLIKIASLSKMIKK
ncbi:MAG: septum formation protein Maf [Candidatus Schekmanbacteria bacterium]|nr:MAG: septum formation protein Maf [Candidatus Schekmanbacteria bacterium]